MNEINTGDLFRTFNLNRESVDAETRTVDLAFSSEEPVERWFGNEILDHNPNAIRLGRLNGGGAVLVDHDPSDHVGVVESVSVDGDRVGRATVRFGNSARATEIFNDYRIHRMVMEEEKEGAESYRALDWEPYEVSIVSIPADASVGVGRSANSNHKTLVEVNEIKEIKEPIMESPAAVIETPTVDVRAEVEAARRSEVDRIQNIE